MRVQVPAGQGQRDCVGDDDRRPPARDRPGPRGAEIGQRQLRASRIRSPMTMLAEAVEAAGRERVGAAWLLTELQRESVTWPTTAG